MLTDVSQLTFFRPTDDGAGVTTKTPLDQRIASFVDVEGAFVGSERLVESLRMPGAPPIHIVVATIQDLW